LTFRRVSPILDATTITYLLCAEKSASLLVENISGQGRLQWHGI